MEGYDQEEYQNIEQDQDEHDSGKAPEDIEGGNPEDEFQGNPEGEVNDENVIDEPRNELTDTFAEINGSIEDVDRTLSESVPTYSKAKEKLDPDTVKLCAHYLLGTTSPSKATIDIGFLSSHVSPIKKFIDQSPPEIAPEEAEEYNSGNNVEELEKAIEHEMEEDEDKYGDAVLQQKFWGRDQGKLTYHREVPAVPITKYKYQPELRGIASIGTKPSLGFLDKYRSKY